MLTGLIEKTQNLLQFPSPSSRVSGNSLVVLSALAAFMVSCQSERKGCLPPENTTCCNTQTGGIVASIKIEIPKVPQAKEPLSIEDMVKIPTKTIYMPDEKNALQKVQVAEFYVSPRCVTNAEFAKFVKETGYITVAERPWGPNNSMPAGSLVFSVPKDASKNNPPESWWEYKTGANWQHPQGPESSLTGKENFPVTQIAYEDALAFAAWAGAELPTRAQFIAAATDGDLVKPNHSTPSTKTTNFWQGYFPIEDTGKDGYIGICPDDAFPANANGLYGTAGNVWEMTQDALSENEIALAGGSAFCADKGVFTCKNAHAFGIAAHEISTSNEHIGFRLVINANKK